MQNDDQKLNSWWQSTWASAYLRVMALGIALIIGAFVLQNLPNLIRFILGIFGFIITVSGYFAALSRWKKI